MLQAGKGGGKWHRRKLGPAVKIKTPAHPAKLLCMRNKSAQQRAKRVGKRRGRGSEGVGVWEWECGRERGRESE